ncbi:MAG: HAMP domain-containing histidine kinase, partial [Gammaproteobacteria bacterium]|nr:HAMP domain-containing histidine kinase [Gammaproteobacteria bacterium]
VGLALIMGWRLGRTLLARVDLINETAERVTEGDLSHRVPLSGQHDEFDELAGHINSMLARIEILLMGMRQVTDNIAHDLRRPLARMRNRIEVTLLDSRENEEYRRAMQETKGDAEELMQTFNALLEIAQAEAGSYRGEWVEVNLSVLLQDLYELYEDQAAEHNWQFKAEIEDGLKVKGNRQLLAQALTNLLDNAFKFTQKGGLIQLQAKHRQGKIQLCVSDNGPGIPADQKENVTHRFVRLESARSTPGNGLGLSLVKAVADLHKARLELKDNSPGLRVVIEFTG